MRGGNTAYLDLGRRWLLSMLLSLC